MNATAKIRVLLADDQVLLRQGLRAILEREADIKIVGEANNGNDVIRKADTLRRGVIVMDVSRPGLKAIGAIHKITADHAGIRVVVLSTQAGEDHVKAMVGAGASAYVLKSATAKELLSAIRLTAAGYTLHPGVHARAVAGDPKTIGFEGNDRFMRPELAATVDRPLALIAALLRHRN